MSRIKECIIPRAKGGLLVEVDYKQLEVVVLALLSKDPVLISDLNDGLDMHCMSTTFLCRSDYETIHTMYQNGDEATIALRKKAKACSFLVQFGGGSNALADGAGISKVHAAKFIANYYKRYKVVKEWQDEVLDAVKDSSEVVDGKVIGTWSNDFNTKFVFHKKPIPWDPKNSSFMPTEVKNYPVQGTAADIVKTALGILVPALLKSYVDKVHVINTIHDSFILDVSDVEILEELCSVLEYTTTTVVMDILRNSFGVELPVPLKVDIEVGKNWDSMENVDEYIKRNSYKPPV